VREAFHADARIGPRARRPPLSWTRGNPFFAQEMLKALVESRALHERDGTWHGWEAERRLPALHPRRGGGAGEPARRRRRAVANLAAVVGTRTSHEALVAVTGLPEADVLQALDELRAGARARRGGRRGVVVRYEFTHPLVRDVLYGELGTARARLLHATVAEALESLYGGAAFAHADELAYHFSRAESRGLAAKAVR
jgi:adenylate cyclase